MFIANFKANHTNICNYFTLILESELVLKPTIISFTQLNVRMKKSHQSKTVNTIGKVYDNFTT